MGVTGGLLSHNVFAYCGNNPVVRVDESGRGWHILVAAVVGAAIGGTVAAISEAVTGGDFKDVAAAFIGGNVGGFIQGLAWSTGTAPLLGAAGGLAGNLAEQACADWFHDRPVDINVTEAIACTVAGTLTTTGQYAVKELAGDAAASLVQANMEIITETSIRSIQTSVEYNNNVKNSSSCYDYRSKFKQYKEYGLY